MKDVSVSLYRWQDGELGYVRGTSTDRTGDYRLQARAGTYALRFDADDLDDLVLSSWLGGRDPTRISRRAGVFTIFLGCGAVGPRHAPASRRPADRQRAVRRRRPLADAYVTVLEWNGEYFDYSWFSGRTAPDGSFAMKAVPGSTVTVQLQRTGYRPQYLGGGTSFRRRRRRRRVAWCPSPTTSTSALSGCRWPPRHWARWPVSAWSTAPTGRSTTATT